MRFLKGRSWIGRGARVFKLALAMSERLRLSIRLAIFLGKSRDRNWHRELWVYAA
jgi:hypothetical protein